MEKQWFQRTQLLIGEEGIEKLKRSKVVVFGVGGVGGFICEALIRAGIGNIIIVDKDTVDITNINRQIIATTKNVGKPKVQVMKDRILEINPSCNVKTYQVFVDEDNIEEIIEKDTDYVIDAIDTITSKLSLVVWCENNNINIISSMGTGNKLDPTMFKISDIYKTSVCPLAKVMRKELKNRGVKKLKVLYSEEKPFKSNPTEEMLQESGKRHVPATISFVPSVAGLILAGEAIKDILGINKPALR